MLVDSHCHLNYEGLAHDVDGAIARAHAAGVRTLLAINTKIAEFEDVYAIASAHDNVFCSVGVHPHEARNEPDVGAHALVERAGRSKTIGIGESGLDYYYDKSPRDQQQANFRAHIRAARETGLPLIVHTRDAEDDTAAIMREEMAEGPYTGVIHCFTASEAFAEIALELGFYISLSGIVTFKSARDLQATAKIIPADRLLVETDSPFLAPVPFRGKTCEPAFTRNTAEFVAELRGVAFEELARVTTDNFFALFRKASRPKAENDNPDTRQLVGI
ncbi:MAG: TatD family hydrolase [Pseudomonadota bacterium]